MSHQKKNTILYSNRYTRKKYSHNSTQTLNDVIYSNKTTHLHDHLNYNFKQLTAFVTTFSFKSTRTATLSNFMFSHLMQLLMGMM